MIPRVLLALCEIFCNGYLIGDHVKSGRPGIHESGQRIMVESWYMHAGIAFVGNGNNRNLQCNIHCARSCKKMLPVLL